MRFGWKMYRSFWSVLHFIEFFIFICLGIWIGFLMYSSLKRRAWCSLVTLTCKFFNLALEVMMNTLKVDSPSEVVDCNLVCLSFIDFPVHLICWSGHDLYHLGMMFCLSCLCFWTLFSIRLLQRMEVHLMQHHVSLRLEMQLLVSRKVMWIRSLCCPSKARFILEAITMGTIAKVCC